MGLFKKKSSKEDKNITNNKQVANNNKNITPNNNVNMMQNNTVSNPNVMQPNMMNNAMANNAMPNNQNMIMNNMPTNDKTSENTQNMAIKGVSSVPNNSTTSIKNNNISNESPTDVFNKQKKLQEIKADEEVVERKEIRTVNDPKEDTKNAVDSVKEAQRKQIEVLKRQKEYGILLEKIRQEEKQRASEQESIRLEREKIAKEKLAKEKLMAEKDAKALEAREAKIREKLKKGEPTSISDQLSRLTGAKFDPKKEIELEAKKQVLEEQFADTSKEAARMSNPILFDYLARSPDGKLEKGSFEALSRVDVYSFLTAEGYDVYEINAAKVSRLNTGGFKFKKSRLIFYLSQLSAYLKSGIALADAVKILDQQASKVTEKRAWRAVYYDLSMGDVLSVALDKRGDTFPKLLINMIKTAEMTGNLTETLDDMVDYYTESEATRKQMVSAMTYPAVVSIFAAVVVTFILMWVVPQFVSIYKDLGSDLPLITKIVMKISDFLVNDLIFVLIGVIILCIVFIYLYRNVIDFKRKVQILTMKLPIFGNIIIYNEVTVFTKTFANLLNHNVFITDSMQILSKITNNEVYKKLIHDTGNNLVKGEPISKAFENQWAFPNIAYQMLLTGEKTGRLGPMMERVSNYYQEQHRNIINSMKSLIEPVLIITLALIVGGILLAVIIPMFGMYDSL